MKTLIIGRGEVGVALTRVLSSYNPVCLDKGESIEETFDIMHISFGYFDGFVDEVKRYQEKYRPKYTVIHSTVPVGTSFLCGAIHSPIRGLHPDLEEGIRVFEKFIGGEQASLVADYFRRSGLRVIIYDKQETTEALKLFDTEYYRECIEFTKKVKRFCDSKGLNFSEVYTLPNQTYNSGYVKLGHPEYVRPVLQPIMKEIGGHCLTPNQKLLNQCENSS